MIHAKWVLMAAGLALLTACSSGEDNSAANDTKTNTEEATSETASETKEEATGDSTEEQAAEEEVEETTEETTEDEEAAQAEPQYRVNQANWAIEPIDNAEAEAVLLTIDDAPDKYAVEMAETLKELDVPAIFFVNGHFLDTDEEKENLKKIHDMGFVIGNHTYNHTNLGTISEEEQREEILSISETVEQIIGEKPKFFRAPNGTNTDFSKSLVEQEGMVLMNWTYGYDWNQEYMDKDAITDIMVNTEFLRNGANLLMHDREWTAAALPGIVSGLSEKGYSFIDPKEIETIE